MKRGDMYNRDMRAMPGCIVALILLSIAAYGVTTIAIAAAVLKLLAKLLG